jgi:hypothetical protein
MADYGIEELTAMFPEHRWGATQPGRCTSECTGEAKWIKQSGANRQYAHVQLRFVPAPELRVTLAHEWPAEVPQGERVALDLALLAGVMDGLVSTERPAWHCAVSSTRVAYVGGATTPELMRATARLATDDALRKPAWILPSSEPA